MKKHFFAFFLIALASELGTSWLVQYSGATDVGGLICFHNLEIMIANRLWIWAVFFLLLSVIWLSLSKGSRTA
ncbi:MAG: hypothetical protein V7641_511 [Blastocatellia bacterium]